jgi:hypothetical protein
MLNTKKIFNILISSIIFLSLFSAAFAQKGSKKEKMQGKPLMWESVDISQQDLFLGPGGEEMRPDLSSVSIVKIEEDTATYKKYRIKDGAGRIWVAKINDVESQPETAAVRLIAALGYKTEINYLAPTLTVPGKGEFKNVRLEARPENVERLDRWKWNDNPFKETKEFQGLKIMMAFLNNWDLKDSNTVILKSGDEIHYVISDLGATFGKLGSNNMPIFWRIGRSKNEPEKYSESEFIKEAKDGKVDFSFKGKWSNLFENITVEHGHWLADLPGGKLFSGGSGDFVQSSQK